MRRFQSVLDGLVKEGTIIKAKGDAVIKAMAAKREKFTNGKFVLFHIIINHLLNHSNAYFLIAQQRQRA